MRARLPEDEGHEHAIPSTLRAEALRAGLDGSVALRGVVLKVPHFQSLALQTLGGLDLTLRTGKPAAFCFWVFA